MTDRRTLTWETIKPRVTVLYTAKNGETVAARVDDTGPQGEGFTLRTRPYITWVDRTDVEAGRVTRAPSCTHSPEIAACHPNDASQPGPWWLAWCKRCTWSTTPHSTKTAARASFRHEHRDLTAR